MRASYVLEGSKRQNEFEGSSGLHESKELVIIEFPQRIYVASTV